MDVAVSAWVASCADEITRAASEITISDGEAAGRGQPAADGPKELATAEESMDERADEGRPRRRRVAAEGRRRGRVAAAGRQQGAPAGETGENFSTDARYRAGYTSEYYFESRELEGHDVGQAAAAAASALGRAELRALAELFDDLDIEHRGSLDLHEVRAVPMCSCAVVCRAAFGERGVVVCVPCLR